MESKQTAIEWLAEKVGHNSLMSLADYNEILEKAKAMEKEQIMAAFYQGENNSVDYFIPGNEIQESEQYYKETYH